jgi:hypothetical protein
MVMNPPRRNYSPQILAALGSVVILSLLPFFLYFALIVATGDAGGPLNLVLIPCANLMAACFITLVICIPLSLFLEQRLPNSGRREHFGSRPLLLSGVVWGLILIFIVMGFALAVSRVLNGPDTDSATVWLFRFLYLGGIPLLLSGFTYWFLLEVVRKVMSRGEENVA